MASPVPHAPHALAPTEGSPASVAAVLRSGRDTSTTATTATFGTDVVYLASHVPLRVFRGHPDDDVAAWTDLAHRALAAADLDKDDATVKRRAAAALESALRGAAADTVAVLDPKGDRSDPGRVLAALLERFGSVNARAAARGRLYAYRRTTESVAEFAATLTRRCFEVDPKMTEEERVSHFLRTVDEPTAAVVVSRGVPATLAEAITTARNAEHAALFSGRTPTATAAASEAADVLLHHMAALTERLIAVEARTNNYPVTAAAVTRPPRPFGTITRPRPTQAQPTAAPRRDASRDRWTEDGTIICNLCHQPGHKASQCAQHPRNRPQPPPGPATTAGARPRPNFS